MKQKFVSLLTIFSLLAAAKKQFKEFDNSVPNDSSDEEYISMYCRNKFQDAVSDALESLWEVIGKAANHDIDEFLPLAVDYFTDGKVVLEKKRETPNDNPNPNEEDAE